MRRVSLGILALVACVDRDPVGPLGTPDDVHTPAGTYAGFRLVMPCTGAFPAPIGVIGTGRNAVTGDAVVARGGELLDRFWAGPHRQLVYGGGGTAIPCDGGATTTLILGDWRLVDPAIAEIGAWLTANDLQLEVAIDVSGPIVPLAE